MTAKSTPDPKRRAPRAFKVDVPNNDPAPHSHQTKKSKKTAPKSAKRKPKTFVEPDKLRATPDEAAQRLQPLAMDEQDLAAALTPAPPQRITSHRQFSWGKIFWLSLIGLVSLGFGLWVDQLITSLFDRTDWLGWLALGFVGLLSLASLSLTLREIWGLRRMARIDRLRTDAASAIANDDMKAANQIASQLNTLYAKRPDTAQGRSKLAQHREQIIDGSNLIALIERDLMRPLDQNARGLVMGAAKRVSIVTAVSPRALIDIGYVLWENVKLIRRIADLYGGRPGSLGFWRLTRNVVGHLAITGTIAIGDGLVQQLVGQGVAAKLSSRLGEGVINGMLTARIGIAAIDLCRPLPFSDQNRPTVSDFMGELVSLGGKKPDQSAS